MDTQKQERWGAASGYLVVLLGIVGAAFALMVLAQGCQHDPYAHSFTTEKPQADDVVGRYVLTKQTVVSGGSSAMQGRPCVVVLAADGTFKATNVPPYERGAPPISSLDALVSGSGTWQLDQVGSIGGGFSKQKPHWGVWLTARGRPVASPGFTGDKPPYGLIFTIGDGDAGTVMILERAEPSATR